MEGRSDDVLMLPSDTGEDVAVHPVVFEKVLDDAAPAGWQVRASKQGLQVSVVQSRVPEGLPEQLRSALTRVGVRADLPVVLEAVAQTAAGASGKRPRISRQA